MNDISKDDLAKTFSEGRIHNIMLSGEDSRNFTKDYYTPSPEALNLAAERNEYLRESIRLRDIPGGYEADIRDLDLSWLN